MRFFKQDRWSLKHHGVWGFATSIENTQNSFVLLYSRIYIVSVYVFMYSLWSYVNLPRRLPLHARNS